MRGYQVYFFVLKVLVILQVVFTAAGFRVKDNAFFAIVNTLFKVSLGLFLAFFFWPYPPKGMDFEDGVVISLGGLLILTEIEFAPAVALYAKRDEVITYVVGSAVKNE